MFIKSITILLLFPWHDCRGRNIYDRADLLDRLNLVFNADKDSSLETSERLV